jgi:hypothetical protein
MSLINLAQYMTPLSVLIVSSVVFICHEPWNLSTHMPFSLPSIFKIMNPTYNQYPLVTLSSNLGDNLLQPDLLSAVESVPL